MTETILARLAPGFASGEENLAVEGLAFILEQTAAARRAMHDLAREFGLNLPELRYGTQDVVEESRLDLVGRGPDGQRHLIIEAKFWAGLTDRQPVDYLRKLPSTDGLLLFLAPEKRLESLWDELQRRCKARAVAFSPVKEVKGSVRVSRVELDGSHGMLAVTSWRTVLDHIRSGLVTSGETTSVADLEQLQGLCARMAAGGFLPISEEEVSSPSIPRRLTQYGELIDSLVDWAVGAGIASTKGLRVTPGRDGYGRYIQFLTQEQRESGEGSKTPIYAYVHINLKLWQRMATPLWLRFWRLEARSLLVEFEQEEPPRLLIDGGHVFIPLFLTTNRERDAVVDALEKQVKAVHSVLLQAADGAAYPAPAESVPAPWETDGVLDEESDT